MECFEFALESSLGIEGIYGYDPVDPGGQTYKGISRVYWPFWPGWPQVDAWISEGADQTDIPDVHEEVEEFYLINFWNRFQGNDLAVLCCRVAAKVFDISVNRGVHAAVINLQDSLSLLNRNGRLFPDLELDGVLGDITLRAADQLLVSRPPDREDSVQLLCNTMMLLQGAHYIEKFRKHPEKEKYVGWILRAGKHVV